MCIFRCFSWAQVYWLGSDCLSFLPGSQRVNFSFLWIFYLFICISASVPQLKDMHVHVPQIWRFVMHVLSRSPPLCSQRDVSDNHQIGALSKKITQLRGPASRLGIRRVMICLKYCSSEHWTIPPMVRVNSFWSSRCQFGNHGDLCLILARCNQENNRWLCLTGEPRTCQRNRWKFINNTPDSMPSWGEFFQKKACNPLFHPSQTCIQMQRGVFCNQGRERPQRKIVLLRCTSFVVQDVLWIPCEISHFCTTSIIKLIYKK